MNEELILSHYKLPLREVPKGQGFGYLGALSMSKDREMLQCHICGKMFAGLSMHLAAHKTTADEYREKFGIARSTALVSEKVREQMKERCMKLWLGQSKEQRASSLEKMRSGLKKANFKIKNRLETKNKNGTCPDQLLQTIKDLQKKLGKIPSNREYRAEGKRHVSLSPLIFKTFGSWNAAVKLACGSINPVQTYHPYTDDELLAFLKNIYKAGYIPTPSDARRGLMPSNSTYQSHFGSLRNARIKAGIPDVKLSGVKRAKHSLYSIKNAVGTL